ncbi:hypothetical protein DACRYDRAFT_14463 [Dacryopinax primogenitus]|uniref:General stress protein FMN-binding split barrel domain-containing protein n=1 Tax=Dacryopinax primogenitus (strain DJM 731) TaxID=1858805 RepID=M5G6N6_DACPD|nr:uncharacterized protein DACRYDRAFT_14463 [Dacryopinax primogenitus]EJU04364.1 hypothetical protein DACRYDRAFT_14463 [Dacryopinax primogenitus]
MSNADPYTKKAEQAAEGLTPQQKIDGTLSLKHTSVPVLMSLRTGLKQVLKSTKYCMFTTRSPEGELHARCMAPASTRQPADVGLAEGLRFSFIANNATFKMDEIEFDSHVNVSFLDPSSTCWVSVAGKAQITNDRETIKSLWSPLVAAWFGDLGDGVHKGDASDPRVSAIQVVPDSIRYWYAQRSSLGQMTEIVTSAMTGGTAAPGQLRTITKAEIQLVEGLNTA